MKSALSMMLGLALIVTNVRGADEPKVSDSKASSATAPTYETQTIEGWTVQINSRLLVGDEKEPTAKAIVLLTEHLQGIVRVVPEAAVTELRKIPFWLNPPYPGVPPHAEYHPDSGWLKVNHRDPAMAKGVEITDIHSFEAETKRMPVFVLHELAHGYHDRFLSFEQPDILAAYSKARASKSYDKVERWHGIVGEGEFVRARVCDDQPQRIFRRMHGSFFRTKRFFSVHARPA